MSGPLDVQPPTGDASELIRIFDLTLGDLTDHFTPTHTVQIRSRPSSPRFDAECRPLSRNCRIFERLNGGQRQRKPGVTGQKRFVRSILV